MLARPFDWRDLPYLHALRSKTLFLDKGLVLTRGSLQVVGAMLSSVLPGVGIFTAVAQHEKHPRLRLIGQVMHHSERDAASLTFLTPARLARPEWLIPLLRLLAQQAAAHHALRLLAEIETDSSVLPSLMECGFQAYGEQRIWKLPKTGVPGNHSGGRWRMAHAADLPGIQRLYKRITPAATLRIFPALPSVPSGLVFARGDAILGYVALRYGLAGVVAQPLLQPEMSAPTVENALAMLAEISLSRGRPLYVCVRTDQQWLDSLLLDLGASVGPLQTLLIKPLTTSPLKARDTGALSLARRSGLLAL
ncbi:MAG: hypothetical protein D6755_10225 [Anaerolineae bacterium]|nr:MAG: hypothetical protein D6755_10225 [Anaerolineae bacterium]